LMVLRAYAAFRRQDQAAARLSVEAFDFCGRLGIADAPLRREPEAVEALLPLAIALGSAGAKEIATTSARVSVTLLGRFELRRGARVLRPPPGLPTGAICAVAALGGSVHADQLTEALWPGARPDAARNRLRNLLSRLRVFVGEVLVREEERVVITSGSLIDSALFEERARAAQRAHASADHLHAAALARTALDLYGGELLPSYRYEAWAAEPRERLRLLYLDLLDLLADRAQAMGEVDEAARMVQRGIDAEPYDEERFLRLAELLTSQGRVGSAWGVLRQGRVALGALGLLPSQSFLRAEAAIGKGTGPTSVPTPT